MKRILLMIPLALLSASCVVREIPRRIPDASCDDNVNVVLALEGSLAGTMTKSILDETVETMLTQVTLASYGADGKLLDVRHYDADDGNMELLVRKTGMNNVYALVNMGDMSDAFPDDESKVASMCYMLEGYDDVQTNGIPMCGSLKQFVYSGPEIQIPVERLFAKVSVRVLHTELTGASSSTVYAYNMCNNSLYVRQANRRLYPFSEYGSRALAEEDVLDESDYNPDLNDRNAYDGSLSQSSLGPGPGYMQDTTLVFYVPENVQGRLLAGNTDASAKSYESIDNVDGVDYGKLCTYVELTATKVNNGVGYSGSKIYRCYLGEDGTSDFSVRRNGKYDITISLTDEGMFLDSWKAALGDDWADTRTLRFVEAPYVVYQGKSENVFVHYHRATSSDTNSQPYPEEWTYIFDDEAIADAGLTYSFDSSTLETGENGCADFCFKFTASEDAKAGTLIPLKVVSTYGSLEANSSIYVAELGDMSLVWDFCPSYVAQEGTVTVSGVPDDLLPLSVSVADGGIARVEKLSDNSFNVIATGKGETEILFMNSDGSQKCSASLSVKVPAIEAWGGVPLLNPDGQPDYHYFSYYDEDYYTLANLNTDAVAEFLLPEIINSEFIEIVDPVVEDDGRIKGWLRVKRLYDSDGNRIAMGERHALQVRPAGFPDASSDGLEALVRDPFVNAVAETQLGEVHDYTLFGLSGVDSRVKVLFAEDIAANKSFEYEAPKVNAATEYVNVSIEPAWASDGYTYGNEMYSVSYNHNDSDYASGASLNLTVGAADASTKHSAGRHDVYLSVRNRHSQEEVAFLWGCVDVYVHTAIGAKAVFGSQLANYSVGGKTFSQVYNTVAGSTIFNTTSSAARIHYVDVSAEYLTDVDNVLVLNRMNYGASASSNIFNALDVVLPDVDDGTVDSNTALLYSVMTGSDDRISVGGETYGVRKGIGRTLYRALRIATYERTLSESDLLLWFLGYNSATSASSTTYAARYTFRDPLEIEYNDFNLVPRNAPFYYNPEDFRNCLDSQERGYHVFHFLDEMMPETAGWINLIGK